MSSSSSIVVSAKKEPTGWLRISRFSSEELHLVIYSKGENGTSYANFTVPIPILRRLLEKKTKAVPVFDEEPTAPRAEALYSW